jgi:hypothetical protein
MIRVNVDNFRAAETALIFDNQLGLTGGVNQWIHYRAPTPVDQQPVIRMNRDTLYSGAIADISAGGTITLPEADGRYMTVMVINEEHYIHQVFDRPGSYELTVEDHGSPFVNLVARTFVDANDPTTSPRSTDFKISSSSTSTRRSRTHIPTTRRQPWTRRERRCSSWARASRTPTTRSANRHR